MPRPGDVIDTFTLEEAIGAGGMGAVFLARDARLDRRVALKLLPPDQADDPEVVARFYQEGRAAAQLDDENIARVYSLGQDGIHHYIVFEFIDGINLRRKVDEQGPSTVSEAVDVTLQIAQALVHAAERGVVHRDIKPSNIIITPQGRAKLVDMGLARRFERRSDPGLTQTGVTLGTFDYISPEQARDPRDVDVRSDLYSLGCTLYHMLTGQPPFPGGTVLQKLIQHQEEAPPDVRSLNPAVPPELARVLEKLMAKDPDRRHQSPEQLVRDLLSAAGQAGIALPRVDAAAWPPPPGRRAWERHLVFLLPALGFILLAAWLLWWSRDPVEPAATSPLADYGSIGSSRPRPSPSLGDAGAGTGTKTEAAAPIPTPAPVAVARNISARAGDDLAAILAAAPPKAVITLADDGPYFLGGGTAGARDATPTLSKDLTIKADAGKRPVLKLAADALGADRSPRALLSFAKGRAVLEGLTFEVSGRAGNLDDRAAAIWIEDAELRLKGCSFRRGEGENPANGAGHPAIRGRVAKVAAGDLPPPLVADQCHFNTGAAAIECEGPADVQITDCTFGPDGEAIRLDNDRMAAGAPRDVLIRHSSFMAGAAPVFQVQGSTARFQVEQCVLAPGAAGGALLLVDAPTGLTWNGRSNLYGPFDAYLETDADGSAGDASIRDFDRWIETPGREVRSLLMAAPIWKSADPVQDLALERDDPARAFRLADDSAQLGARRGPFGARLIDPSLARSPFPPASPPSPIADADAAPRPSGDLLAVANQGENGLPGPAATTPRGDGAPAATETVDRGPDVRAMPPMLTNPPAATPEPSTDDGGAAAAAATTTPPAPDPVEPQVREAPVAVPPSPAPTEPGPETKYEDVIRSSRQLSNALDHFGANGGTLWIARDADLELSTINLPGPANWSIEAEPGGHRPRLRFRPSVFTTRSASAWTSLFQVPGGGKLRLRGLDILIDDVAPMAMSRLASVCLGPGAELELVDCAVTLTGGMARNTIVAALPPRTTDGAPRSEPAAPAVVRVQDSFLRSAGDAFLATADRRIECDLRNSLIATDGGLLHALGGAEPVGDAPLRLGLNHVLARVKGGLVHLESSMDEPELPRVDVRVESSILSVGGEGSPLLRVDGRGSLESLRDRIRWTGESVGYHQISIYRRDDTGQTGIRPRNYPRADWTNIFTVTDESPTFEIDFANKAALALPATAITRDDLRAPSVQGALGPDLDHVPEAPRGDL